MRLSVVIATYNRLPLLLELLKDLAKQTLAASDYEVIVVDDGSATPVRPHVTELQVPYRLTVIDQDNAGPAAARHNGVLRTSGEVIVFVDDDMQLGPDFLAAHLAEHDRGSTVVQGYIAQPTVDLPVFEKFHAYQLERFARDALRGKVALRGIYVCTGNVSVRRADYLAVGGFDTTLGHSEDRELGLRLELAGGKLAFCPAAKSLHRSDRDSLEGWLSRSFKYGVFDTRIAKKHPHAEIADPWRFILQVNPLSRPLMLAAVAFPEAAATLARLAVDTSARLDARGYTRLAIAGTTVSYGLQYFRGVRAEATSLPAALNDLVGYLRKRATQKRVRPRLPARGVGRMWGMLKRDYAAVIRYRAKYNRDIVSMKQLPGDMVKRVGVQMMGAIRLMHLWRDSDFELGAQVTSRLIRHVYGADIHWEADLAPGMSIIHGNGLVISRSAKVAEGCILFHNVTLGEGTDPNTRAVGAPVLERNVHVGPGATLIGPITVGEGSKIMAGAVLARSVPPYSLVAPPEPIVTGRKTRRASGISR